MHYYLLLIVLFYFHLFFFDYHTTTLPIFAFFSSSFILDLTDFIILSISWVSTFSCLFWKKQSPFGIYLNYFYGPLYGRWKEFNLPDYVYNWQFPLQNMHISTCIERLVGGRLSVQSATPLLIHFIKVLGILLQFTLAISNTRVVLNQSPSCSQ